MESIDHHTRQTAQWLLSQLLLTRPGVRRITIPVLQAQTLVVLGIHAYLVSACTIATRAFAERR